MAYVFDSGPLIVLFRHYYPNRFPSLWEKFEAMVENQEIVSVREVFNEITSYGNVDRLVVWAKDHKEIFSKPTPNELKFVAEIFKIKHFQGMISKKGMMQGKPVADPFIIAKARISDSIVVSLERWKKNSANDVMRWKEYLHHEGTGKRTQEEWQGARELYGEEQQRLFAQLQTRQEEAISRWMAQGLTREKA